MSKGDKKVYRRGVSLTFRLPKKMKYSDDVIELINTASDADELNVEIIHALELYAKYKRYRKTDVQEDFFEDTDKVVNKKVKVQEPTHKDTNIIKVENWNQNISGNDAEDELFDDIPQNKGLTNAFNSLRKRK